LSLQSYLTYPISDPEFFHMGGEIGVSWRKMVFGLCFFHASVQERVKFGPLGWNIPYQFSDPDLKISLRQLQSFLLEFPDSVPFKALVYLTGECNYGGRVTDAHDRRTLVSILSVIYQPNILHDSYSLSNSGAYLVPEDCEYQDYIEHIKRFPLIAMPEAFGLHQNADITKDNQEVNQLLTAILSTQVLLLAPLNPDSCSLPSSPLSSKCICTLGC
jgi:dynein heavy chain